MKADSVSVGPRTDVDRLHTAILDPDTPQLRASGKTTIALHQLAGEIQVGRSSTVCALVKYHRDLNWVLPMMLQIFYEQGIMLSKTTEPYVFRTTYEGKFKKLAFVTDPKHTLGAAEVNLVDY